MQDQRLIQFLMGFNDVYAQARGNILMMNPLPEMDYAYSFFLQDESQREVYANAQFPIDSASFMKSGNASRKFKGRRSKYNPNVSCTNCFKTGHVEDGYYRLIGYPEVFEFTNSKEYPRPVKENTATSVEEIQSTKGANSDVINSSQHFSKEQCTEIAQMFTKFQMGQTMGSRSEINANVVVGTVLKYLGICLSVYDTKTWIIDSVNRLCVQLHCYIFFTISKCPLQDLSLKRVEVFGEVRDGFYLL
ncbi:uncharacterized protein LOC132031604 [Lycium ferocissimum]|uniref:uncharacterized protein LOC132031604 n=1 Tax=Lycium ferocissimum TaxID=112874 RepID=UPI0028162F33|nr:uncharacterized protein LOC132031604 [Lycium ferocissimum]